MTAQPILITWNMLVIESVLFILYVIHDESGIRFN